MNIEQLNYIVEVAKTRSLAVACKTLNVTQSALSQAITKLESELNLKIFDRTRTGAVTTKEGDAIIEKAISALQSIYEIKEEAFRQINNRNDLVRISTIAGITTPIINTYLTFKENNSLLKLEVNEKESTDVIEDVKNNIANLGFIALSESKTALVSDLMFTPVACGKIRVFVSSLSSLASKKSISPKQLSKKTFALYKDGDIEEFITHFQNEHGMVDILLTTSSLDSLFKTLHETGTVSFCLDVTTDYIEQFQTRQLVTLDIGGYVSPMFQFGWIQKKDYKMSKEANAFMAKVNERIIERR